MNTLNSAGFKERKNDPLFGILADNTATKGMTHEELIKFFANRGITIIGKTK